MTHDRILQSRRELWKALRGPRKYRVWPAHVWRKIPKTERSLSHKMMPVSIMSRYRPLTNWKHRRHDRSRFSCQFTLMPFQYEGKYIRQLTAILDLCGCVHRYRFRTGVFTTARKIIVQHRRPCSPLRERTARAKPLVYN